MANKNVSLVAVTASGSAAVLSKSLSKTLASTTATGTALANGKSSSVTLASSTASTSANKFSIIGNANVSLQGVSATGTAWPISGDLRAVSRVLFDGSGNIAMIAILDNMNQINDPAFSPPGLTAVNISVATYTACASTLDLLNACINSPQGAPSGGLSLQIQSKINAINADIAAYQQAQIAAAKVPITDGPGM